MGKAPSEKRLHRLAPIEGLRAYLALWVVATHVIFYSSAVFETLDPAGVGNAVMEALGSGTLGVEVFMIVSGFVITLLLDKRHEAYLPFITRRFFRLYPLYFLLLVTSLLLYGWRQEMFLHTRQYMSAGGIGYFVTLGRETSQDWWPTLLLHFAMLHTLLPGNWVAPMTAYSFIIAAWSISVEWQYYLLAPLIFALWRSPSPAGRFLLWAGALGVFLAARHWQFLTPNFFIFVPFFLIGTASYFAYKALPAVPPNSLFPPALGLTLLFFLLFGRELAYTPLLIWIPFFALLCEPAGSFCSRCFLVLFNNPVAQFLGACSYGIYLCHEQAILGAQALLLAFAPTLGPLEYMLALLALTVAGTIALAAALHYLVELPGMELGRKVATRLSPAPTGEEVVIPAQRAAE